MDTLHNDVLEAIAGITRLSTEVMPLESIWLEKPLQTARKRTIRITKGDMVRIENSCLVDCQPEANAAGTVIPSKPATHLILECKGTIHSRDLQIICENLDTQELITVRL